MSEAPSESASPERDLNQDDAVAAESTPSTPPVDWGLRVTGIALVLAVLLPFRTRHDVKMLWDLHVDASILSALVVLSIVFLVASFSRPSVRRFGVAFAGFGLGAAALGFLLEDGSVRSDLGRLTVAAGSLSAFAYFFTVGAERAMHADPRSRSLAAAAAFGWFCMLCAYVVPFERHGEFDSTLLGAIGGAMDRQATRAFLLVGPGVIAIIGLVQCVRRLGSDRDAVVARGQTSPWLSRLMLSIPMGLAIPIALLFGDRNAGRIALIAFAFCYAIALAVQASLELLERLPRQWVIRAGIAMTAVGAVSTLAPRVGGSGAAQDLAQAIGHEMEGVLRGGSTDPEFHGGYSDFDLRATEARVPEGAVLEAVAVRLLGLAPGDDQAWLVVRGEQVQWTCGGAHFARGGLTDWSDGVETSYLVREDLSDATRSALGDPDWLPRTECREWQSDDWQTFGSRGDASHVFLDHAVVAFRVGDELRWYTSGLGNIREHLWIGTAYECPGGACGPIVGLGNEL